MLGLLTVHGGVTMATRMMIYQPLTSSIHHTLRCYHIVCCNIIAYMYSLSTVVNLCNHKMYYTSSNCES